MIRLFRVFVPTSVIALILSETVLIFSCFLISSYAVLDTDSEEVAFGKYPTVAV